MPACSLGRRRASRSASPKPRARSTAPSRDGSYDADGPFGTVKGLTKGTQTVVYHLETEPPAGTCDNIVIADCKVPRRLWGWTLEVAAFVQ
ncbi:MAG: hypothetical protein ACOY4R_04295 [Pseudomonadota bacterium]